MLHDHAAQAQGGRKLLQVNFLGDPGHLFAVALDAAANSLGKVLRTTTSDASVVPLAPAPAPGAGFTADISSAPAPGPLTAGEVATCSAAQRTVQSYTVPSIPAIPCLHEKQGCC
jgi:hypothetical protein